MIEVVSFVAAYSRVKIFPVELVPPVLLKTTRKTQPLFALTFLGSLNRYVLLLCAAPVVPG